MIITYVGKEQCDILYHVIMAGIKLGKTIAVFDNSITHDFFEIFSTNKEEDIIETQGIVVAKDYTFIKEKAEYDYIFIYEGLYPKYKGYTDLAIIAPSYSKTEWEMIREYGKERSILETKIFLVLRDKINNKISDRVALSILDFDPTYMMNTELNEKDYSSYISLVHNRKAKISKNGEIYEVVSILCEELYHLSPTDLKKYL